MPTTAANTEPGMDTFLVLEGWRVQGEWWGSEGKVKERGRGEGEVKEGEVREEGRGKGEKWEGRER